MRTRMFAAALVAMLAPAALFAGSITAAPAPSAQKLLINVKTSYTTSGQSVDRDRDHQDRKHGEYDDRGDRKCGRGNAWGCRRKNDERYDADRRDDRWEHDRYDRDRHERDDRRAYERERNARERYERQRARERYDRDRYERERDERERYSRDRYGRDGYDQRDRYYPARPITCARVGNRILSVCLP